MSRKFFTVSSERDGGRWTGMVSLGHEQSAEGTGVVESEPPKAELPEPQSPEAPRRRKKHPMDRPERQDARIETMQTIVGLLEQALQEINSLDEDCRARFKPIRIWLMAAQKYTEGEINFERTYARGL